MLARLRIIEVIACVLVAAVAVCGILIYISQTPEPPAPKEPQVIQQGIVPPKLPPAQAARVAAPAKLPEPSDASNEAPSPAPPPGPPGGPELDKQYTLAQAVQALDEARAKSLTDSRYREAVNAWYVFLADPVFTQSTSYPEHCEELAAMAVSLPQSPTPLIAIAQAHLHNAWRDRGEGSEEAVTEQGRRLFREEAATARKLLEQAIELGVKDGEAHTLLLEIARVEGRPLAETRALFEEGRKIDPTYFSLYEALAEYLLPRWHGQPGDLEEFAAEVARTVPGDDGLDAYLHIAYDVNQFDSNLLYWGEFDRALLAKAAEVAVKRYPNARNIVPFAALCTTVAQDRAAACRIRPAVKHRDAFRVWLWRDLAEDFFRWCDAEEISSGQADWLWGAPLNYPALSFAGDSQALWCASGYGPTAATRWNIDTKRVEICLPARGSRIQQLVVDSDKNWVAATLGGERRAGWMLWSASMPDAEPYICETTTACEAIAIHPQLPRVAFTVGRIVRTMDMTSKSEGQPMDVGTYVRGIRFSADGRSLAVWGDAFSVWDVESGQKRYDLPTAGDGVESQIGCEKILDFDEEGRVWGIAIAMGPHAGKRSLVRFSADGKSWETPIADLHSQGPVQPLTAVLSPDKRLLAASDQVAKLGEAETFQVWNIATGKSQRLAGHHNHIGGFAFSSNGQKLASVSQAGGPVKIWTLAK